VKGGEEEMMNKAMVLFAGALATLSLVGPVFAESTSPATKEPSKETSPPTEKSATHKVTSMRHVTGEVVSVNQDAKTLTVKRGPKGKEMTFAVEADAAAHLSDLKAGDRVKIGYVSNHHQFTARSIVKSEVTAKAK
jgi:Cu/Ag efflux protein CusF